jgi:chemotaxis protein methyltransferase CheR
VLQQAIFLEPDFIIAHFALFNLYRKLGKESQEMVSYKNVVRLLEKVHSDQTIPESDGLTAAQLLSVIKSGVNRNH